ncbi:pre-mRNA processing factor 3-domain-containing protein [Scheffersomyces coipomensis]|uniref:pre-mRNA processing factor 3-domain-containing protein n=1 Tax=Scheffersomyces coipomensis TaxID=1788519 RepID=UPI00315DF5EE
MSNGKRSLTNETGDSKRPKLSGIPQATLERAKARLEQRRLKEQEQEDHKNGTKLEAAKGGLNTEIHPLLRSGIANTPVIPKNFNPLKQNARKIFDSSAMNPYLDQSAAVSQFKPRSLTFNPKGKYIEQANRLREKIKQEEEEKRKIEEKKSKGLTADENLGEHLYKSQFPPPVEWWDQPYLRDRSYEFIDNLDRVNMENENQMVSIYIQHPILIPAPWLKHGAEQKAMMLTKKEMKRIRKNDRQDKLKDKQDRIKLGLDPAPAPKVKLSNLMNVLTNEAIKDPTSIEMRVKQEMEERLQKHLQQNEERQLTKEERHEKIQRQHEKDVQKGYFTLVFKIKKLINPQHKYKIDINAKQNDLVGICLENPRFNLVVVEGGEKSIKLYKKLMMNRINWQENVRAKDDTSDEPLADLSDNSCEIVWEGQLKQFNFQKWSLMYSSNDDEAIDVLQRFKLENYWRQTIALDK